jgi:hypothetical protein
MPSNFRSAKSIALSQDTIRQTTRLEWASETQRDVFEHGPTPLCAAGGFGAAKTWVLCLKVMYLMDAFPGSRWVIARRRWTELQKTTMQTFFKMCPSAAYQPFGRRADTEKILRLNNGSELYWLYFDDPEVATVIRGLEINGFFIDQAEEVQEEVFDLLSSRLGRWDKVQVPARFDTPEWEWRDANNRPVMPPYALIACNPDNELHWIFRRFHPDSPDHWRSLGLDYDTGEPMPSFHEQGYRMYTLTSDSNRFLGKAALKQLKSQDESFQKRYRRGEWGIPEGQVHEISPLSIIDGDAGWVENLLSRCTLHRTLDHGDTAPTACLWWAVDKDGNVYCYREYYVAMPSISTHREAIARLSGVYSERQEQYIRELADPSIFTPQQRKGESWSIADEYSDISILDPKTPIFWDRADNDELGTRNRINEYLRVDPKRKHPITGMLGAPRLYFIMRTNTYPNGCDNAIVETRAQRRTKIGTHLGKPVFSDERQKGIRDHAYDCVRYFIASRAPSATETPVSAPAGSFLEVRNRMAAEKRAGLRHHLARQARLDSLARKFARSH